MEGIMAALSLGPVPMAECLPALGPQTVFLKIKCWRLRRKPPSSEVGRLSTLPRSPPLRESAWVGAASGLLGFQLEPGVEG